MARINRITAAIFTGVTMDSVISVDVDYNGEYNTSKGGGSLSMIATLRSVGGTISVTYEGAANPAALDLAPDDLVLTCMDDADGGGGAITVTLPDIKPSGNSMAISDSGYATFTQRFQVAPGTGVTAAGMAPVVS